MLTKYASTEKILEVKVSRERLASSTDLPGAALARFASLTSEPITESDDGYIYVRSRAISSRVNKNNDGWPSEELAKGYRTFVGKPIFVDHKNDDPKRTRGVIVDSKLHVEDEKTAALDPYYSTAPDNHKPETWIEILEEVDAKTFPKLADAILTGKIDGTSMGANIERSLCSVCGNEAVTPAQYCSHVQKKGAEFQVTADDGSTSMKKAYEDCIGISFFEDSFVFDPADPTALNIEVSKDRIDALAKTAFDIDDPNAKDDDSDREINYTPQSEEATAPQQVDTLRKDVPCPSCKAADLTKDPDGFLRCEKCDYEQPPKGLDNPDLSQAQREDLLDSDSTTEVSDADLDQVQLDPGSNATVDGIQPVKPMAATNHGVTTGVINEMKWTTELETDKATDVVVLFKGAAVEQTQIGFRGGVHFGTQAAFQEAGISGTVTYPQPDPKTGQATLPIPSPPMPHMRAQNASAQAEGLPDFGAITITLDVPDEQMQQAIQIIHDGGMGGERPGGPPGPGGPGPGGPVAKAAAQPPRKNVAVPGTKTAPKTKIVADQLAPVEADSRTIRREETEGEEGITRVEEIVEQIGDEPAKEVAPEAPKTEPATDETPEEDENKKEESAPPFQSSSKEDIMLLAMSLADDLIAADILSADKKLGFIKGLEDRGEHYIHARRHQFEMDKHAGATVRKKVGSRGLPRGMAATASTVDNSSDAIDLATADLSVIYF